MSSWGEKGASSKSRGSAVSKTQNSENGFVRVAASDEVQPDQLQRFRIGRRSLLLIRWENAVLAVDSTCPHAAADLSQGELHRWKLFCPDHAYCFDIRSGGIVWPADEMYRLKRYEAYEEAGSIYVRLD